MSQVRDEMKKLIEELPEEATWDDLMYQVYVRQKIDKGLTALKHGETLSHEEAKKRLLDQ